MSVLSMVAFRMVTQEGLRKCLKIYEKLEKSDGEKTATPLTTSSTTSETHDAKSSANSRSARRRVRRRKLQESRRGESKIESKGKEEGEDTKESRESDDDNVDMTAYNLVTHANKRTEKDFLERTLMAAFLLRCLQRVGFFARPTLDDGNTHHRSFLHLSQQIIPLFSLSLPLSRAVFNLEIIFAGARI